MIKTLFKLSFRSLLRNPWLFFLLVFGIALGVSVVVGIDISIQSSLKAFQNSSESLTGRATHQITGDENGVPESHFFRLVRLGYKIAPVVTSEIYIDGFGRKPFRLLGVDPFFEADFRNYLEGSFSEDPIDIGTFITQKNTVVLSHGLAKKLNTIEGDTLEVSIQGYQKKLNVLKVIKPTNPLDRRYLEDLVITDISSAQELSGSIGKLSYIDVIIANDMASQKATLESHLPLGARLSPSSSRTRTLQEMTKAFELNMFALSLLGLLVGMFLVWSCVSFSVVRRRSELSTLRSLGLSRTETTLLIFFQSIWIGLIGSIIGIFLGEFLGRGLVTLVSQTISDLFYVVHVNETKVSTMTLVKAWTMGLGASLISSIQPAWEVSRIQPREGLFKVVGKRISPHIVKSLSVISTMLIAFSILGLWIFTRNLGLSLIFTLIFILGFCLAIPVIANLLLTVFQKSSINLSLRLSMMRQRYSLKKSSIPMAAFTIALATVIGIAGMIHSFRHTVILWLDQRLVGDIYITVPNQGPSRKLAVLDKRVVAFLEKQQEVQKVDFLKSTSVESDYGQVQIVAFQNDAFQKPEAFLSSVGPPDKVWDRVSSGEIMISEPLAYRWGIKKPGSEVQLFTPQGWKPFKVAAIYYDYASSQGVIGISLDTFRRYWQDASVNGVAIHAKPNTDLSQLSQAWQKKLGHIQNLDILPNKEVRKEVFNVFDRTFQVTQALKWLAVFIAFFGIVNSLLSQVIENIREYGLLRAMGFRRREINYQILTESLSMGLISWMLSIPLGVGLTYIMVYIINFRAFGWTLQMKIDPHLFFQTFLIALGASVLSTFYPAWKIIQLKPMKALRIDS